MTDTLKDDTVAVIELLPALPPQLVHGEIDVQVATAKRYPRSIATFRKRALEMATLDEETAGACFYVVPRDGKNVEGPSARLAEIVASAWGNLRIEAKVIGEDERFVMARSIAWDLETNVAVSFETRRRITKRDGKRYSDDMIATTSNAAASIALRNAVLKVVPSAFTREIYYQCRQVAVGTVETLADRRAKMVAYFQKMGVQEAAIFVLLGVKGLQDITLDHLVTLKGMATAIKEGDIGVDEAFAPKWSNRSESPGLTIFEKLADPLKENIEKAFATLNIPGGARLAKLNEYFRAETDSEESAQKLLDWCRDEYAKRKIGQPRAPKGSKNAKPAATPTDTAPPSPPAPAPDPPMAHSAVQTPVVEPKGKAVAEDTALF